MVTIDEMKLRRAGLLASLDGVRHRISKEAAADAEAIVENVYQTWLTMLRTEVGQERLLARNLARLDDFMFLTTGQRMD